MRKIEYKLYRCAVVSSELGKYIAYGVRAYLCLGGRRHLVAELRDMSLDKRTMVSFVHRLNKLNTSPFLMIREAENMLDL